MLFSLKILSVAGALQTPSAGRGTGKDLPVRTVLLKMEIPFKIHWLEKFKWSHNYFIHYTGRCRNPQCLYRSGLNFLGQTQREKDLLNCLLLTDWYYTLSDWFLYKCYPGLVKYVFKTRYGHRKHKQVTLIVSQRGLILEDSFQMASFQILIYWIVSHIEALKLFMTENFSFFPVRLNLLWVLTWHPSIPKNFKEFLEESSEGWKGINVFAQRYLIPKNIQ